MMQQLETWFNSPRVHFAFALICGVAAQFFPQYAVALNSIAGALGYGGIVAGAPTPKVGP